MCGWGLGSDVVREVVFSRLPRHGVRERRAVALVGLAPRNDMVE